MGGWVKLHRCVLDKTIWQNHNLWRVWSWCLMKATHKEYEQIVGMTKVVLQPGQFIFGRYEAAKELYMKPSTVFDCMKWLKSNSTIDIKSDNKKSVITIINWDTYQSNESEPDTNSDTNSDNTPTTTRQQPDTNKNVKKGKNEKNISSPDFEKFYLEYPRHEGRADAEKAWRKIKPLEVEAVMVGLGRYKQACHGREKQFIKTPAAWLNGRRWEDEYESGPTAKPIMNKLTFTPNPSKPVNPFDVEVP